MGGYDIVKSYYCSKFYIYNLYILIHSHSNGSKLNQIIKLNFCKTISWNVELGMKIGRKYK